MPVDALREIAVVDRMICDACGLCMPLCPPAAIHMRRDGLLVDPVACTGCRKCIAPCPVGALRMVDRSGAGTSHPVPFVVAPVPAPVGTPVAGA